SDVCSSDLKTRLRLSTSTLMMLQIPTCCCCTDLARLFVRRRVQPTTITGDATKTVTAVAHHANGTVNTHIQNRWGHRIWVQPVREPTPIICVLPMYSVMAIVEARNLRLVTET